MWILTLSLSPRLPCQGQGCKYSHATGLGGHVGRQQALCPSPCDMQRLHWQLALCCIVLTSEGHRLSSELMARGAGCRCWAACSSQRKGEHAVNRTQACIDSIGAWSWTGTGKQPRLLDNHSSATCISQRTVFLSGKRNFRCSLELIW